MYDLNGLGGLADSRIKRIRKAQSHERRFDDATAAPIVLTTTHHQHHHHHHQHVSKSATATTIALHQHNIISTSSWRVGEALVQKQLSEHHHLSSTEVKKVPAAPTSASSSRQPQTHANSKQSHSRSKSPANNKNIKRTECHLIETTTTTTTATTSRPKTSSSKENLTKSKPRPYDPEDIRRYMERQKLKRIQVDFFIVLHRL